ncbi:helix-turn-helix domain-containing protein [Streptomyces sp. NPDC059455]|uniref:helix-turn-helix domain-containing protein n=1 Tax=Streptomyces sp. NPDC059455 TaxID=3346837 RepID=UPI0036A60C52
MYIRQQEVLSPRPRATKATNFSSAINLTASQIEEKGKIFNEWQDGPFAHLTHVEIPRETASGGFSFSANGYWFNHLLSVSVYCDSLVGISGNQDRDPVVADLVTSGELRFASRGENYAITPGRICIRDTRTSWEFTCAPRTQARVIALPRHALISRVPSSVTLLPAYVADVETAEVRFLLNFLDAIEKSSEDLDGSLATQNMALDACASVFAGMLTKNPQQGLSDHQAALVKAAKNVIENHLDDADLSPSMIARLIGVSLRSIYRSFEAADESIMSFVRRRRLEKAREDLMRRGSTAAVSEVAARWHFSDASHFIRTFKSFYGSTPAVYARNNHA